MTRDSRRGRPERADLELSLEPWALDGGRVPDLFTDIKRLFNYDALARAEIRSTQRTWRWAA